MGRYFGLTNSTKKQSVSEGSQCWKGNSWCDLYAVMHKFGWDKTDKMVSACYDSSYEYDPNTEEMIEQDWSSMEEEQGTESIEEQKTIPWQRFGFSFTESMNQCQAATHVPEWDNDCCKHCGYRWESGTGPEYDPTFFCN